MTHELKILPEYFNDSLRMKKFELRKDDRDYKVGDTLILKEYDNGSFTGAEVGYTITYILRDVPQYGLKEGYAILGLQ